MRYLEGLEGRTMLAVDLTAGVLTVNGTTGDDLICLRMNRDGSMSVLEGVRSDATPPAEPTITSFTADDVKTITSIVVNADAGNDRVWLKGSRRSPFSLGATINGGDGDDRIAGGAGADIVNGGLGNDRIEGADGDDKLYGDDGNDRIDGGRGSDLLSGGAGNDYLTATDRAGTDTVDGGDPVGTVTTVSTTPKRGKGAAKLSPARGVLKADADYAIVDQGDAVTGVEVLKTLVPRGPKK